MRLDDKQHDVLYVSVTSSQTAQRAIVQRGTWARRRSLWVVSDGNATEHRRLASALRTSHGGVNLTMLREAGNRYIDVPHKWVRAVIRLARIDTGQPFHWYFFVDDDTFVFVNKLETALSRLNASRPTIFGLRYTFPNQPHQKTAQHLRACHVRDS